MEENIPSHVVQLIYGRFGFNAVNTAVAGWREPFVLLHTGTRHDDPYSIVDATTGRTVVRYADPVQARHALDEFADRTYRWRPPEET